MPNGCIKVVDRLWAGNLLHVPRTIWKGALSFGLVNIPVGLYPATSDKSIHFNQFEEGTSDRIRYKKVNERTGNEVPQDRIVRGFDLGGGEYVILSDEELESGRAEEVAPDRDLRLRRAGRYRPGLLPVQLLPRARGRGRRQGLRPAPPGHGRSRPHRHRHHGDAEQGVPGRHPARGRRARPAHDVLLRRGALARPRVPRAARRRTT